MVEEVLARFAGAKTVERVRLPAKVYRVRKNDTLAKIARRFGISVATLKKLNNLSGEPRLVLGLRCGHREPRWWSPTAKVRCDSRPDKPPA